MPIASELEKLVALRNRGDLSQSEFSRAKERLLSEEPLAESPPTAANRPIIPNEIDGGKTKRTFLIAMLSTIAAGLSGGSAAIDPSPLSLLAFAGFTIASTLNWVVFFKRKPRK